jgi:4-alpha-glucanotransferase
MGRVVLGLVFHNHQPIGNFGWVNEEHYEKAYLPMVAALERHPGVRVGLHYTGSLLDWLRLTHPDLLDRIRALAERGQVEVVGGGFYEPVLAVLPEVDRVGQVRALADAVRETFGTTPTGMWLAERVWEPGLPHSLVEAGMQWTIVDDTHLLASGLGPDDLYGYYLTEDDGRPIGVFPSLYSLRYTVPWRSVQETIALLRGLAENAVEGQLPIAVMGDDGEKFGAWPTTYEHVWARGYMDRLFTALEENNDWLLTMPLGEYRRDYPALGRVYLPTASYVEMSEWVLPAPAAAQFETVRHAMEAEQPEVARWMRGGFWRSFMTKYPEINRLHKRMLRTHTKVHAARALGGEGDGGLLELYRGQNNDAYWHGVFGGIYMNHMRAETTHRLLLAENAADAVLHAGESDWFRYEIRDLDADGADELLLTGQHQNLLIDPAEGGMLQQWDIRRAAVNVLDTLARRPEAYHETLRAHAHEAYTAPTEPVPDAGAPAGDDNGQAEEENEPANIHGVVRFREAGLEDYLTYDAYDRGGGIEHLLDAETGPDDFRFGRFTERGDFVRGIWTLDPIDDATASFAPADDTHAPTWKFTLRRDGHIAWPDGGTSPLAIEKTYMVQTIGAAFTCHYRVTNRGPQRIEIVFASEWNANLQGGGHNDQCYTRLPDRPALTTYHDTPETWQAATEIHLGNTHLDVDLSLMLSPAADLWKLPIETVSNSEGGFERVYQGTSLIARWPLALDPEQTWEGSVFWTAGTAMSNEQ